MLKIKVVDYKEKELNRLSQQMYDILYKNDQPNYKLSTDDFMKLLFVLDDLSLNPLLRSNKWK